MFSFFYFSLGSACSQTAVLMFKLEARTRLQPKVVVASKLYQQNWSKNLQSQILISLIRKNINFQRVK